MEVSKLNSINNSNYLNDVKDSSKTNALISNQKVEQKSQSNSLDGISVDLQKRNTSFVNNVSTNLSKLASLQKSQAQISNQLEITTKIVQTTSDAVSSPSIQLDDKQPEIKNLLDSYNTLSQSSNSTEGFDETGIFFDGVLGSKPLSAQEIFKSVEAQREKLQVAQESVGSQIQEVVSNMQQSFKIERTQSKVETKVEFKNIDFAQESSQFSGSTLSDVKDGIIPSQANATPSSSERLLA